jgi:DNA-directed RNA polymerase specialized sigma subunit
MTDKKDLIKNFIAEVKQRKFLDELYKKNTIEFDNYFKRSKKTIEEIDPTVGIGEHHSMLLRLANHSKMINDRKVNLKVTEEESQIIDYFYNNANLTLTQIAKNLKIPKDRVTKAMNRNLDRSSW